MPTLVIIAGPNGAGNDDVRAGISLRGRPTFRVRNADEIARNLSVPSDVAAARIMLTRIDELVEADADFVIETTLANLTYARKIPVWQKRGYRVSLIYIRLSSVDVSLTRVRKRVEAGGHTIPAATIRRRFERSQGYFTTVYKPLVDIWYEWASHEGAFLLQSSGERHESES